MADRELIDDLRATAPERLRRFGLPEHLVEQVPGYLADALPAAVLVHADITADHVFVDNGQLVGIIDWGDAIVADRSYELVALYLDTLNGDARLFDRFLDTAGWQRDDTFCHRSLQAVLEFQYDAIAALRRLVDLDMTETLDDLADAVFAQ